MKSGAILDDSGDAANGVTRFTALVVQIGVRER
jgi:hypothetical protein